MNLAYNNISMTKWGSTCPNAGEGSVEIIHAINPIMYL